MKTTLHKSSVMKRIIPAIAIAATTMVACNTNPRVDSASQQRAVPTVDTTGYAQFQAWKAQNELANTANYNANAPQQQPQTQTRTVVRYYPVRSSSGSTASTSSGTAERKRGWSSAAKGAVIGGVVGAGAGAIISKNDRWKGGVIGGVLGAGAGYGIGAILDNKKKNQQ